MTDEPPRKRKRRGSYQRRGAIVGASLICSTGTSLSVLMKYFRLSLSESVAYSSLRASASSVAAAASAVRTRTHVHDETSESINCSSSATTSSTCTAVGLSGSFASAPPVRMSGSVASTTSSACSSVHVPVFTDANNLSNIKEKDKDRRNDTDRSAPCAAVRASPSRASSSIDISIQVPSLHSSFVAMSIDEDAPTE